MKIRTISMTLLTFLPVTLVMLTQVPAQAAMEPVHQCSAYARATIKASWFCLEGTLRAQEVGEQIIARSVGVTPLNVTSSYTAQTTKSATYGIGSSAIGTFQVKLKTSLNGRSARWQVIVTKTSGPKFTLRRLFINCREEQPGPDSNCGVHAADNGNGVVQAGPSAWTGPWVQGNYLSDSNPYHADLAGYVEPSGYSASIAMENLRSDTFYCWGNQNDRCYFQ